MSKKNAYSQFSLDDVRREFSIHLALADLFQSTAAISPSQFLQQSLEGESKNF